MSDRFSGIKVGEYEAVDSNVEFDDDYEYEEITVEEFLDKGNLTEREKALILKERFAINIHCMISEESYEDTLMLLEDCKSDKRLEGLYAVVFLSLKKKGRGKKYSSLSMKKFKSLVDTAFDLGVNFGFDSCSAPKFMLSVKNRKNYKELEMVSESCESSKFSSYINARGEFFPCSFIEGEVLEDGQDWSSGLDVVNCNNFIKDIWMHPRTIAFREKLLKTVDEQGCCNCPHFNI